MRNFFLKLYLGDWLLLSSPLAEKLRQLGSEDAAKQVEEFTKQEIHHGEMIDELFKKYKK